MRYVMEAVLRPFMDWFESIGIPGEVVPVLIAVTVWALVVPRNIARKRVTWRDWVGSLGVIVVVVAFTLVMFDTPDSTLSQEARGDAHENIRPINPEDIERPWRRITPEDLDGVTNDQ